MYLLQQRMKYTRLCLLLIVEGNTVISAPSYLPHFPSSLVAPHLFTRDSVSRSTVRALTVGGVGEAEQTKLLSTEARRSERRGGGGRGGGKSFSGGRVLLVDLMRRRGREARSPCGLRCGHPAAGGSRRRGGNALLAQHSFI